MSRPSFMHFIYRQEAYKVLVYVLGERTCCKVARLDGEGVRPLDERWVEAQLAQDGIRGMTPHPGHPGVYECVLEPDHKCAPYAPPPVKDTAPLLPPAARVEDGEGSDETGAEEGGDAPSDWLLLKKFRREILAELQDPVQSMQCIFYWLMCRLYSLEFPDIQRFGWQDCVGKVHAFLSKVYDMPAPTRTARGVGAAMPSTDGSDRRRWRDVRKMSREIQRM